MQNHYACNCTVFIYASEKAAWHFAALSEQLSAEIKMFHGHHSGGWGSLPVRATVGNTTWKTSLFPDTKLKGYILPLKAEVRKKEAIVNGDNIELTFEITG